MFPQDLAPIAATGTDCVQQRAKQYLARGQFKEAEDELRRTITTDPLCPEGRFPLAYALLRQNLAEESLAEYTAAARLRTPNAEDLRNVALDYVLLDDYSDADLWAQRALQLDVNDSEGWYMLGRIRYSTGKFQDAVKYFENALVIAPENVKAETNLGLAYEGLNEVDKAVDAYQKAIAFGEKSGKPSEQPMINLAIVLAHRSSSSRTAGPYESQLFQPIGGVGASILVGAGLQYIVAIQRFAARMLRETARSKKFIWRSLLDRRREIAERLRNVQVIDYFTR